ncbi:MAG TPA: carbamoyltransferase C-terminal domain-containing protein [Chloroflexota bacterium]|nr:carbamoyltransferase C-terminal domain-containing protein [Chloroflexota bacterium]
MYILGINAYHGGASACLIRDGRLVAGVEEERLSRIKYQAGFPTRAIRLVLEAGGIGPEDLDHIGISRRPTANLARKALFAFRNRPSLRLVGDRLNNGLQVGDLRTVFCEHLAVPRASLKAQFHNVEHHRAHMASAFFVSPFDDAAVLSVDGMGDFVSTMWGTGGASRLDVAGEINFPHSLGLFYTAITQWLGFLKYGDEGKVMGLAPLGRPRYLDRMEKVLRGQADGTFELDLDYFVHHAEGATMSWSQDEPRLGTIFSGRLVTLLGEPRVPGAEITPHHCDVAASLQAALERTELALVRRLHAQTGRKALCLAGGVALNSAFNGKILPSTGFDDIYIQPAAGDAGTSLGVCYYIYHQLIGAPRCYVMQDAYTGPEFDDARIRRAIGTITSETLDEDDLVARVAELVAAGNVVGWFQGRMEWGPRALGNRSIIADPRRPEMKDVLNARIKHREPFRPFAPSILLEDVGDYFDQSYPDPFMLKVYNVLPQRREEIPAVTHADGTGRLQTVDRQAAPRYWKLISAFRERTGVPVVLNTSFNENEPIVCTPEEAVAVMERTRMDALAIGNHLAVKDSAQRVSRRERLHARTTPGGRAAS